MSCLVYFLRYKLLFEQTVRSVVICKKPHYTTVTRHNNEQLTVIRLTNNGQHTTVFTTQVSKVT